MQTNKDKQETLLKTMKLTGLALAAGTLMAVPNAQAENAASGYQDYTNASVFGSDAVAANADCLEQSQADLDAGYTPWCPVLSTYVKNSGSIKDLVLGLSFETMLFTDTLVKSKGGQGSEAKADAEIQMFVQVDGYKAAPGVVTFDRREQTLFAKLGGYIDETTCVDENNDGIITFFECDLTEEEIKLTLDTTAAHSFNFLAYDIGSGDHNVTAYARLRVSESSTSDLNETTASGSLGKGTLSVWEVHGGSDTSL